MVFGLWGRYVEALKRWPMPVKSTTAAVLMATGDAAAQQIQGTTPYDYKRTLGMFVYGALFQAPFAHNWFQVLDRLIPLGGSKSLLLKVLVDQSVAAPTYTAAFFMARGLLAGKTTDEMADKFQQDYPQAVAKAAVVFGGANLINFYFVPLQFRVLFVNCTAFAWNTYLATVATLSAKQR